MAISNTNSVDIEVANFIASMPHLRVTVQFDANRIARIIGRTGYNSDAEWDKLAIKAATRLYNERR